MAAGYFEGGESAVERAALEWLEQAPAPALYASDSDHRSAVETYVPVNDEHGGILQRSRQSRVFPRTRPHDECVYYVWQSVPGKDIREGLESVCKKVTRIGHSSSAVQMWVAADGTVLDPNWIPAEGIGDLRMRITGKGTLQMLSDSFNGAPYGNMTRCRARSTRQREDRRQSSKRNCARNFRQAHQRRGVRYLPAGRPIRNDTQRTRRKALSKGRSMPILSC